MRFLIIDGPGINLLQYTEQGVDGELDYDGLVDYIRTCCAHMGVDTVFFQSNHEGDLIDEIQSAPGRADGIIINPAGYAHYSVAILDALRQCGVPAVEVMLETPDAREPFRRTDVVSFGCQGHFIGEGPDGYMHAAAYLVRLLRADPAPRTHIAM